MTNDVYGRIIGRQRVGKMAPKPVSIEQMPLEILRNLAEKVTSADIQELIELQKAGKDTAILFRRVPELSFRARLELDKRNARVLDIVFPPKDPPAEPGPPKPATELTPNPRVKVSKRFVREIEKLRRAKLVEPKPAVKRAKKMKAVSLPKFLEELKQQPTPPTPPKPTRQPRRVRTLSGLFREIRRRGLQVVETEGTFQAVFRMTANG